MGQAENGVYVEMKLDGEQFKVVKEFIHRDTQISYDNDAKLEVKEHVNNAFYELCALSYLTFSLKT